MLSQWLQELSKHPTLVWAVAFVVVFNPFLWPLAGLAGAFYASQYLTLSSAVKNAAQLENAKAKVTLAMLGEVERVVNRIEQWTTRFYTPGQWQLPAYLSKTLQTRDGTSVLYHVMPGKHYKNKDAAGPPLSPTGNSKVIILAAGLGVHGFSGFSPLIHYYGDEYTFITWDYRGLFGSGQPSRLRRLSVPEHANDLLEIMQAERIDKADVVVGYSMGVQVTLEFALLYPERTQALVLLNGAHGKIFHSAFQPIIRIPVLGDLVHTMVTWLVQRPHLLACSEPMIRRVMKALAPLHTLIFADSHMKNVAGTYYVSGFVSEYLCNADERTIGNFWRHFLELDSHSVYHMLSEIHHPTLVVGGIFDFMTPAYHSSEMAAQMPNARLVLDWFSAHLTMLENPRAIIDNLALFMEELGLADEEEEANRQAKSIAFFGKPSPRLPRATTRRRSFAEVVGHPNSTDEKPVALVVDGMHGMKNGMHDGHANTKGAEVAHQGNVGVVNGAHDMKEGNGNGHVQKGEAVMNKARVNVGVQEGMGKHVTAVGAGSA